MKKYLKSLYFIVPIIIGILFANGLNIYFNHQIEVLMKQKDLMPIRNEFGCDLKSKGVVANNYFLKQDDIMFLGSSELRHETLQHPSYFFNTGRSKNNAFIVGKEFDQDLQAATIIGSLNPNIKNKKIVFTFSFQWFLWQDGISNYAFSVRFSPIEFYQFFRNPKINKQTKIEFARKIYKFLKGSKQYSTEVLYAKLYGYRTPVNNVERILLTPYFTASKFIVQLKGKGLLYKRLKELKPYKKSGLVIPWNWKVQNALAAKDGAEMSTNNPYGILNKEYTPEFRAQLKASKGIFKGTSLLASDEMNQYKFFLKVCKETGVKPIIVLMPGMNWFYNYIGLSKEVRYKLFDEVSRLAKADGFTVLDFRKDNTKKYFLRDNAHLGTEGWTDVCEKVYKIYNQQ